MKTGLAPTPDLSPAPRRLAVRARRIALATLLAVPALAGPTACGTGAGPDARAPVQPPLAVFSYEGGLEDWPDIQQPEGKQRITTVAAPGGDSAPAKRAMRVELRAGDVTDTGGYLANRAEVYARHAMRGTAPEAWPDPVGSVRWYAIDLYIPRGFCTSDRGSDWLVLTQWKGLNGGSPPVALEIKRKSLDLGGKRIRRSLGLLRTGRWTRIVVGMKLSPDPKQGWVQVSRDGHRVVPRERLATMDAYSDDGVREPDPIYLKQGLYRSSDWKCTQVLYFGPTVVSEKLAALPPARAPEG